MTSTRPFSSRPIRGIAGGVVVVGLALTLGACSTPDRSPVVASSTAASAVPIQTRTPSASAPTQSEQNNSTYIVECVDTNLVQSPRSLTLSCGDSNSALDSLTWSGWGSSRATATGSLVENTCDPSCATGKLARYPVGVVAAKLVQREATQVYTQLTVTFTGPRPSGQPQVQQYPFPS